MPVRACEASKMSGNMAKTAVVLTGKMPVLRETARRSGIPARLRLPPVPRAPANTSVLSGCAEISSRNSKFLSMA